MTWTHRQASSWSLHKECAVNVLLRLASPVAVPPDCSFSLARGSLCVEFFLADEIGIAKQASQKPNNHEGKSSN